jgi:hypothetical protein
MWKGTRFGPLCFVVLLFFAYSPQLHRSPERRNRSASPN